MDSSILVERFSYVLLHWLRLSSPSSVSIFRTSFWYILKYGVPICVTIGWWWIRPCFILCHYFVTIFVIIGTRVHLHRLTKEFLSTEIKEAQINMREFSFQLYGFDTLDDSNKINADFGATATFNNWGKVCTISLQHSSRYYVIDLLVMIGSLSLVWHVVTTCLACYRFNSDYTPS